MSSPSTQNSNTLVFLEEGGAREIVASGGELRVEGTLTIGAGGTLAFEEGTTFTRPQQTLTAAGAIKLDTSYVGITGPASSTYAVTLAAPTTPGITKVIEMTGTTGTNSVTLALNNVAGGTANTTATFTVAGHTLILVSNSTKWVVVKELGVALS